VEWEKGGGGGAGGWGGEGGGMASRRKQDGLTKHRLASSRRMLATDAAQEGPSELP